MVLLDIAVLVAIVGLLAFPVLAKVAAGRQPVAPGPAAPLPPLPVGADAVPLQDLPAGLAADPPPGDLAGAAAALLGEERGARLLAQVRAMTGTPADVYEFPAFERIVPPGVDPAAATDLGARLLVAGDGPSSAIAAYVLFDRAQAGGGCAPHLNQLLLLTAEVPPSDDMIAAAGDRALAACPGDPTAGWLLAQFESQRDPRAGLARARSVRREFPGSAAAWSGEADATLRLAYVQPAERAFVIRHLHERALARYRRAVALGGASAEIDLGIARALAGLGRAREAAAVQQRAVAAKPPAALLQARLVEYLESARRFPAAARAATTLAGMAAADPSGPGWFPEVQTTFVPHEIVAEDANGPLSLGTGRLRPLSVTLGHPVVAPVAPVLDLSFLPVYRPSPGVTGSDRWCAEWSRQRDALLAGRPEAARAGPAEFVPLDASEGECAGRPAMIAGLAALELGDGRATTALRHRVRPSWRRTPEPLAVGGRPRARRARSARVGTRQRRRAAADPARRDRVPSAPLPRRRTAFRRRRPARARARAGWSADEAEALLKRGAALIAGGRREEGLRALRAAEETGARNRVDDPDDPLDQLVAALVVLLRARPAR